MSETPGMAQHEMTRTLVKSQPEVWTQCSDADSLGRHLSGSFGEIRITRLEPEHSVAWEGAEVSGTVRIEPSAWGTRVTLTVEMADEIAALEQEASPPPPEQRPSTPPPEPVAEPAQEPLSLQEPEPPTAPAVEGPSSERAPMPGLWARFRARFRPHPVVEPPSESEPPGDPESPSETRVSTEPDASTEPDPVAQERAEPESPPEEPAGEAAASSDTAAALTAALESLGQAHHRPFSRT